MTKESAREKELARLYKEKAKSKPVSYFAYFISIIAVVYCADEITTQITSQMQTIVADTLFGGLDKLALFSLITIAVQALAYLYRPLSDRYGRKIFLVINTIGMGLGMVFIGVATGIPSFLIGACVIKFFTPHDMQAIYIQECAPSEKRARTYAIVKCIATVSLMIVPILRKIFIPNATALAEGGWRWVYLIPGAIAVLVAVVALFFVRESDAFIEHRIRQLTMTEEEREAKDKESKAEKSQGGLIQGFVYGFTHKQTFWLFMAFAVIMLGFCITEYYESMISYSYAEPFILGGMDEIAARAEVVDSVSDSLLLFPLGSALIQLITGFIADKSGRKASTITVSAITLVTFLLFYLGIENGWNTYVNGIMIGMAVGAYWSIGDMIDLMMAESVPTNLRASILSAASVTSGVLYVLCGVLNAALINILGPHFVGTICLALCAPSLIIALIIMVLGTKETKGVDLDSIKAGDFK